jgi:P27 family predicted phage terminase small subunit
MGRRGPKPTTAEVQAIKGNPGRRKRPIAALGVLAELDGKAPAGLGDYGAALWGAVVPDLKVAKIARSTDMPLIYLLCSMWDEYWSVRDQIHKEGRSNLVVSAHNPDGMLRRHPLYSVLFQSQNSILSMLDRCGLSPTSRTSIMAQMANHGVGMLPGERSPDPLETGDMFGDDDAALPSALGGLH